MRTVSLTHTVLAALLWCAAVFVFVGLNFMKYESASRMLRETRIETMLKNLNAVLSLETDKGVSLSGLKNAGILLRRFSAENPDLISVFVFDAKYGKVLFSVSGEKEGNDIKEGVVVPDSWRQKCVQPDTFFTEKEKNAEVSGVPLLNAFSENTGCLVVRYETKPVENIREEMIKTAFRYTLRLSSIGVLICFFVYFYAFLITSVFTDKKFRLTAALLLLTGTLCVILYFGFAAMFDAFETDIKKGISDKAALVARQVGDRINHVVQNGVPLGSVSGLETYMDGIRRKNKEIRFILVTDKAGRVLYESGSAANAFESDPLTGRIALRKGFLSAASPLGADGAVTGWVQIGINERFVREKNN